MSKALLLDTAAVKQRLSYLFNKQRVQWLLGNDKLPLIITLGLPDQKTALDNLEAVSRWTEHWRQWQGSGELQWCSRNWSVLGQQNLPEKIIFSEITQILNWLGLTALWVKICDRYSQFISRFPQLNLFADKYYHILESYSHEDFINLQNVLNWFLKNPDSQIYLRQLPIEHIDTKWIESHKKIIIDLLRIIKNMNADFYEITGLKREPDLIRIRILDKQILSQLSKISDISACAEELSKLNFPVEKVYIVENLRTGLAFTDLPGAVVIMGLGYNVSQLQNIPWIKSARCYYWGDLDTHGFAILNRIRAHLPNIKSILMDKKTLLKSKSLWVQEHKPCCIENLEYLTEAEKAVYINIRDNSWGHQIRLEQERIFWPDAWEALIKETSAHECL